MRRFKYKKLLCVVILLVATAGVMTRAQEATPQPDVERIKAEHEKLLVKYGLKLQLEKELPEQPPAWLRRLFGLIAKIIHDFAPVFLAAAAMIIIWLLFQMFRGVPGQFFPGRPRKVKEGSRQSKKGGSENASALYRWALEHAAKGEFEAALSCLHKASIRKLVAARLLPPADHLTNKEIRRHIAGHHSFHKTFHELAAQSELATFKHQAVDSGTFGRMKSLYDKSFGVEQ
jgi:hypothetical protein